MNKIKFSHYYFKIPNLIKEAVLLEVIPIKLEKLSSYFIQYDTAFINGFYRLPKKGDYLLLIFNERVLNDKLFTTFRRRTPQKEKYYRSKIGELFTIEIDVNSSSRLNDRRILEILEKR